ncbi:FAD-binding oxidoreductase [Phytohabitans sp. LJ34]|uniref:FAD-binding oxidoreductase n=1 Tax=Phytohabitans sp. LJ34 TaxID=3452217 RepID=UPI003F88E4F7
MTTLSRRRLLRRTAVLSGAVLGGSALATGAEASGAPAPAGAAEVAPTTVRRGDARYAGLTRGQNNRFVSSPDEICLPRTTGQVVRAVQDAVRAGRRISVRSGGHCYEGFVDHREVKTIVDMSEMKGIRYDPTRNAVEVEVGASLGQLYYTLFKRWGVVLPGGACYSVGVGGHVPGGGYGQISRKHGLIIDHMYAVEVVVVDQQGRAQAVVATRDPSDPNRDLWWAHTGGGGGSFGIAVRYWFRSPGATGTDPARLLPAAPSELWISSVSWDWDGMTADRFAQLIRNYGTWHEANSAPDSPYADLTARLEPTTRAAGPFSMTMQMDATAPDSERRLRAFVAAVNDGVGVEPTVTQHRRMPYLHATGWPAVWMHAPTDRYKYMSSYHRRGFTEAQIAALYQGLTETDYDHPVFVVTIAGYGGRVNAVDPSATADSHRDSVMKLLWGTAWANPEDDEKHLAFHRGVYHAVYADSGGVPVPNNVTDGCFINYADADLSDRRWNSTGVAWHDLYFKHNYPRLQQVKAAWDPLNVFSHAQSIRLPGQQ